MKKEKIKNIIIIILLCLLVLITTLFSISKMDENKNSEVTVTVEAVGRNYLLGSSEDKEYLITNYKGDYKEKDKIKFTYKNKDKKEKDGLINIKVNDEDLIASYKTKEENKVKEQGVKDNTDKISNISTDNNQVSNSSTSTNTNTNIDNEIVNYVNKMNDDTTTSSLKTNFVTLVDFIFYGGTIKGYTFKELSNEAKLKVLKTMFYLDSKVDKYFPNYKEEISNKTGKVYTKVKEKAASSYLSITSAICNSNSSICDSAKEDFQNLKKNFGLSWSVIKEVAHDSKESIKNWYEIWREKK